MQDTLPNGPFAIEDGVQYLNLPRDGHLNDQRRHGTSFFLSKLLKRIPTRVKAREFKKVRTTTLLHSQPAIGVPRHDARGLCSCTAHGYSPPGTLGR